MPLGVLIAKNFLVKVNGSPEIRAQWQRHAC